MRLIDKDALLKGLGVTSEWCEQCELGDGYGYCTRDSDFTDACDAICTAPTIEERKTGKWVGIQAYCDHMNEITVGSRFIPSGMVCGVYCNQCWERNSEKKNFCPNCGAKMEGEQP